MNGAMTNDGPAPKLMKSRMRATRVFMLALLPALVFGMGTFGDESMPHEIMDWSGYALVILCVLGRAYCSAFIGGQKNDTVVDIGPFSVVRNPLYVFSFIGIAGIGLQSGMVTVFAFLIAVFVLYYPRVVAREEAFLAHKFGDAYRDYTQRVPRWIPNFSLWKEPSEVTMRPRFVRETMLDASLFFLALPAFELLEALHESGMVPHYLMLP
jgi:protein-S-isoprenylcysteine O-methyltransferase Ste14